MEVIESFIREKPEWVILYLVIILCTAFRWFHIDGLLGYITDNTHIKLIAIDDSVRRIEEIVHYRLEKIESKINEVSSAVRDVQSELRPPKETRYDDDW